VVAVSLDRTYLRCSFQWKAVGGRIADSGLSRLDIKVLSWSAIPQKQKVVDLDCLRPPSTSLLAFRLWRHPMDH
jgi:hypothetical protein